MIWIADPKLLMESGQFHRVPIIMGNTDAEGILVADVLFGLLGVPLISLNLAWPVVGPLLISEAYLNQISEADTKISNDARMFYIKPFGLISNQSMGPLVDMATDALFQ